MSDLEIMAKKLADKIGTKYALDEKFNIDYIIPNITEDILLEEGFEYKGKTFKDEYPYYQKENIEATFINETLILSKIS